MQAYKRHLRDAALIKSIALPNAANGSVTTAGIDTGERTARAIAPDIELIAGCDDLPVGILSNGETMTLVIESAADSGFTSPTTLGTKVFTGTGGAGAKDNELRLRVPPDLQRYVRAKFTLGANTADASALTGFIDILASGS